MTQPGKDLTFATIARGLRSARLFDPWPDAAFREICDAGRLQTFEHGSTVDADQRLFVVVSGHVNVCPRISADHLVMVDVLGAGEVFGLQGLMDERPSAIEWQMHTATTLIDLPITLLRKQLEQRPVLWGAVGRALIRQYRDGLTRVLEHLSGSARARIAAILARLGALDANAAPRSAGWTIALSQSDLASMLAMSRQTVNKELRQLEADGLIVTAYNSLTVIDLAALRNESVRSA